MLSLDQIRVARCSNEYTDGPTVARKPAEQPPASGRHKEEEVARAAAVPSALSRGNTGWAETEDWEERSRGPLPPSRHRDSLSGDETRPIVGGSSNEGSVSSLQRLVASPRIGAGGGEETVRTQPKRAEVDAEERKPLAAVVLSEGKHSKRCGDCGRCGCAECTRPRALPSCWLCGRRCVCSAQSAAEYATCVCCVRGLFYHCSSDDEDTGADKPFSCTQAHCCARWTAVALLATVLPCIACYLPAKACVAACQHCYDATTRPGCRCKGGARHGRTAAVATAGQRDAGEKPT